MPKDTSLLEHEQKRAIELKVRKWVRESGIKEKHDKETVLKMMSEKREQLSKEGPELGELEDQEERKRRKRDRELERDSRRHSRHERDDRYDKK